MEGDKPKVDTNIKPPSMDSAVFGLLTPEEQTALYNKIAARQKEYQNRIEELEKKAAEREEIVKATEGVDLGSVATIEDTAPYLQFENASELIYLKEHNEDEYLKRIFRRWTTLMNEKRRAFKDAQLDMDGAGVYDKLKKVYDFIKQYPNTDRYATEQIEEHKEIAALYLEAFPELVHWQKLDADVSTMDEALVNLVMHYGIKKMQKAAKEKNTVAMDYTTEIESKEKVEEETPTDRIEKQIKVQADGLAELKIMVQRISEKIASPAPSAVEDEAPAEDEEHEEEKDKEPKPKKNKQGKEVY